MHELRMISEPRVHGNGFIQIDLVDRERLHIWGHPSIPRQKVNTPIHNHVFDFTSKCIIGRLFNITYSNKQESVGGTHKAYKATALEGHESILTDTGIRISPKVRYTEVISADGTANDSYRFSAFDYHETFADRPTATIMKKLGQTLAENPKGPPPFVLIPVGMEPDNQFRRDAFNSAFLMAITEEVLWDTPYKLVKHTLS